MSVYVKQYSFCFIYDVICIPDWQYGCIIVGVWSDSLARCAGLVAGYIPGGTRGLAQLADRPICNCEVRCSGKLC